jgi:transposase
VNFLKRLDREFSPGLSLHLILDNYGTHKAPTVRTWLEKHPRFVCHFVPTSSSWLNMVERWFREITDKAIRRGAFVSVPALIAAIEAFIASWNQQPKPFVWTAKVSDILAKIDRARKKLERITPGCTQPPARQRKVSTV